MRFLADESCDFQVVRALRAAGHDVVAVSEIAAGADDPTVIEMAVREDRVFITEDRDFGQLVYSAGKPARGVILLRFPSTARATLAATVVDFVTQHGAQLAESFVVIRPGQIRLARTPRN
jgi:predicted nuclease of predicted toxin-antitoxin system